MISDKKTKKSVTTVPVQKNKKQCMQSSSTINKKGTTVQMLSVSRHLNDYCAVSYCTQQHRSCSNDWQQQKICYKCSVQKL